MTTEYQHTLQDYLLIMRLRAPFLIGAFFVVLLISATLAIKLPPTYRSTGTILVESPQPDNNLVANTAQNPIAEQISHIEDRVMTRDSLLTISNKYNLFKEDAGSKTTTELIEKMRERISVELVDNDPNMSASNKSARSGQIDPHLTSIAFRLSFDDKRPEVAFQVSKDLVTLFLDWNMKLRNENAVNKSTFLSDESDKLKAEVDRLDSKISVYKRQNGNFLPEQMELRTSMLARAETDLYEVEREIQNSNDGLRTLEAQLAVEKNNMGDQPAQELPRLKTEYAKLTATYTEIHPDVRALKRKIEKLENANKSAESTEVTVTPLTSPNQIVAMLQVKVDSVQARIASLTRQKADLKNKISKSEQALGQTPRVKEELEILIRDRDYAQKKYEEFYSKKANAQISANLQSQNISERFTLIEPPILSDQAVKPNRIKLFMTGLLVAVATPVAMVVAIANFDGKIRGADALAHVLGQRPLAVIPYLLNQEDERLRKRNKRKLKLAIIAAIIAVLLIAIAVHFLYMPLDEVFMKILAKLG
jgi:polysaccharide chain length determinant protein (PEP-CTERM system associated)